MNDGPRSTPSKLLRTATLATLAVATVVAAARFASLVAESAPRATPCFVAHYTLARLLADGTDLARSYDHSWFAAQTALVTPGVTDINVNPPTTALLLLPLSGLGYTDARTLWSGASVVLLALALLLLLRDADLPAAWALAFVAFALVYQPVIADFRFANVYVLVLTLTAVAWHGYRAGNDPLTGVALALMLAVKLAGGLLWLLALAARRWRTLAWGTATVATIVLGSLPWFGFGAWRADAAVLADAARRPERAATAYQSVTGLFHHLFAGDPIWNPAPLANAPLLASLASWTAVFALVAASVWVAVRRPGDDRVFAAFVIAGVVVSPLALDYTYTVLLLPIAIAVAWAHDRHSVSSWALLVAAVLPIALDLPYRSPRLAHGAWALLAYPKLGGALLLWAALLMAAARSTGRPSPSPAGFALAES